MNGQNAIVVSGTNICIWLSRDRILVTDGYSASEK